jgi:pyruvate dehydrogenase E2 component (dihydrolipoamide acetyltransferase)
MPEITMPKLSDTMTEGTIVAWKKKKGDQVSAGEVIAEIETDKATMEWESPEDGVLSEIFVEEGGKVEVGQKIAVIGEKGETETTPPASQAETEKPAPAEQQEPETAPPEESIKSTGRSKEIPPPPSNSISTAGAPAERSDEEARVKASPLARRIAADEGLDLSAVKGTGPAGRITESDVRAAAKTKAGAKGGAAPATAPSKSATPARPGEGARINLSGMRKVIAQRLTESLGPVPHFYLGIEVDAAPLMAARAELKAAGEETDTSKITVNDFVLKAAIAAAVKVPRVNASFDNDAIIQYADVDLAIAVAIEDGLVTPVLRGAQTKSLRDISEAVKDLAHRARHKRMKPEEFQGGTFTVSNLGGYGIDSFSAVINPPQGFILAVGRINKTAVADDCDQLIVGHRMSVTMSCDHRVIDGALGAEYLKELRRLLENPALLLI